MSMAVRSLTFAKNFSNCITITHPKSNLIFKKHIFVKAKWLTRFENYVPICLYSSQANKPIRVDLRNILLDMPREPKSITDLRHIRIKNKAASSNKPRYPPGIVYLTVLGNGSKGNPRCLCLIADNNCYMFNCGEGSQRLAVEHKIKLVKLEHIFFTHKSWTNIGGLPGISLTIQDIGIPELCLHGPVGVGNLYEAAKNFMNTKNLSVTTKHPEMESFSDYCMKVDYVQLLPKEQPKVVERANLDIASSTMQDSRDENSNSIKAENNAKRMKFSEDIAQDMCVAYICKINNKAGSLSLQKCIDQGVPPGPLLGQLKNGKDVTLPCGKVVQACDVVSAEEPGPVFIVVECPDERYLDALLSAESFKNHQFGNDSSLIAAVVFHFSPPEIMNNPLYKEWISRFPITTSHLSLNSDSPSLSALSSHEFQHKLNALDPSIFPLLTENPEKVIENETHVIQAESLVRYSLRPRLGLDRSSVPVLDCTAFKTEVENLDNILKEMNNNIMNVHCPPNLDAEYPEIVFLGTGSAIPNKVRNVSSILVNLGPKIPFIMDCGEGTYRQIFRLYGSKKTAEILQNLSAIFVSHLHADHHMGLIQLLLEREAIFKEIGQHCPPLNLIAPIQISSWLTNYNHQFQPIIHLIRLIPNYLLLFERHLIYADDYEQLKRVLNVKELNTVAVHHSFNSYGISFTSNNDVKIVYSGDTMPCDLLVKAGLNCSVLIHEATMEDDLIEDAIIKRHSTTSQAIEIGQKMNAQFTMLTHFSQRYAKIPIYNTNFSSNVAFAFDNMKVQPKHLMKLPMFLPTMKCLFEEDYNIMLKKNEKKHFKQIILANMT